MGRSLPRLRELRRDYGLQLMADEFLQDHMVAARADGNAFGAVWVFTCRWAHPIWSQYALHLVDLTTSLPPPHPKPTLARPGMTHEMSLWAIDPDKPVSKWMEAPAGCMLTPANQAYQFKAESDEAALNRIQDLVNQMEARTLSPDTDYRRAWDALFQDGVSLITNAFERYGQTIQ